MKWRLTKNRLCATVTPLLSVLPIGTERTNERAQLIQSFFFFFSSLQPSISHHSILIMAGPGRACSHVVKTATLVAHQQTRASTRALSTTTSHIRLQGQSTTKVTTAPRKQIFTNCNAQRGFHLLSNPRFVGTQATAISSRAILSISDARRFMSTASTDSEDSEDSSNGILP